MEKKIAAKSAQRMANVSWLVFALSCFGIFLPPHAARAGQKYPGQGKVLFKYSALAAVTFFVTVNLSRRAVSGCGRSRARCRTTPTRASRSRPGRSTRSTRTAEEYLKSGQELFAADARAERANPDEQPAVLLFDNGVKVIKDAKVFFAIKRCSEGRLHLRHPPDRADGHHDAVLPARDQTDADRDHQLPAWSGERLGGQSPAADDLVQRRSDREQERTAS